MQIPTHVLIAAPLTMELRTVPVSLNPPLGSHFFARPPFAESLAGQDSVCKGAVIQDPQGRLVGDSLGPINRDLSTLASSPINLIALQRELEPYDSPDKYCILDGFTNGFSLHYSGLRVSVDCKNLKSAFALPVIVQEKINSEILAGRVAGPFDAPSPSQSLCFPYWFGSKKDPWGI